MNPYLDHLLDLVEADGSFERKNGGSTVTGFADVELAGLLAALVELRGIREALEALTREPATSIGAKRHEGARP